MESFPAMIQVKKNGKCSNMLPIHVQCTRVSCTLGVTSILNIFIIKGDFIRGSNEP